MNFYYREDEGMFLVNTITLSVCHHLHPANHIPAVTLSQSDPPIQDISVVASIPPLTIIVDHIQITLEHAGG